jgi:nicotinamide-nucleotide amidase
MHDAFASQTSDAALGLSVKTDRRMPQQLEALANEILQRAKAAGLTVATAESCSAGRLATALSKGEGASQYFAGGFVTYTKEAKALLLGVPRDLLARETAVSANVATAMAEGAVVRAQASLAVAITGVTGPAPDEDGNPVGLVYCAVARSDGGSRHLRLELGDGERDALVEISCRAALRLLRDFAFA